MDFSDPQFVQANLIFVVSFLPVLIPFFLNRSRTDKILLGWFIFDTVIHIVFDSSWCVIQLKDGGPANSTNPLAVIWNEYGKADSRWLYPDPEILSVECYVMVVMLPLTIVNVFTTFFNSPSRYFFAVLLSAFEIFGTYMTFASEIIRGSPSLHYASPLHMWYYLIFTNGLWVWIPTIVLIHSFKEISRAFTPIIPASKKSQ